MITIRKISSMLAVTAVVAALVVVWISRDQHEQAAEPQAQARENGQLANEGFRRSHAFVRAWLRQADPRTGLIPKNLDWQQYPEEFKKGGRDIWNAKDTAADNYPFMVATAAITDRALLQGTMLDMLHTETRLTSRLGSMPDTYSFSRRNFQTDEPVLADIIFGSSEYVKDGLLPLTEWLGPSPWSERMLAILDDMWRYAPLETPFGRIVSDDVEVNGEMLQTLTRVYWMTGQRGYLDKAIRLGDYYLLGNHHPTRNMASLRLRDHGCEVISGLCELYATVSYADPAKKKEYEQPLHSMLDRILEVGRNQDGLFYNVINPRTGTVLDKGIVDTWGYTFNGYYTVYQIDGTTEYREAALKALSHLNRYRNFSWEGDGADGYADAIESALNLYNREQVPSVPSWIDSEIQVLWKKQRPDGLIEGWHCDGNFARTSLMYSLWKTGGVTVQPWREDVVFGAVRTEDGLLISIRAAKDWTGRLLVDAPRHATIMNLPFDWPRINQWPEWFTAEEGREYALTSTVPQFDRLCRGAELRQGTALSLQAGQECIVRIHPL